jgi:YD repeat-containing protein
LMAVRQYLMYNPTISPLRLTFSMIIITTLLKWSGKAIMKVHIFGVINDLLPFIAAENTTFSALEQAARTAILQVTGSHQDIDLFLEEIGGLSTSQQKVAWSEFNQILRGSPALANALVTTYTYAPIIGITSQTDPNGKITYFGYDGLGRLENVKDFDENLIKSIDYQYKIRQFNE